MPFSHSDSSKRRHIICAMTGDHDCASIDGQTKKIEREGINAIGTREIEKERETEREKASKPVGQSITGIDLGGKCSHDQPT